jgi:hypothetical protein
MADAKLTGVKIRFTTHNDNKDFDTRLNVSVKNKVNIFLSQDLAEGIDLAHDVEFVDPSTHGFDLALQDSSVTVRDLGLPIVNIDITPNGNDRWIFDYTVSLGFDDGKTFSSTTTGVILDQDNRHHTGVFQS